MIRYATAAALATLAVIAAPTAHADDQSYLRYLEAHGQSTTAYPYSPAALIASGHMICNNIRAGADPLAGASPIDRATWGPIGVEAARAELCP